MAISVLRRYLTRELFKTAGTITLVLLLVILSARLVSYLNKAATGEIAPQIVFGILGYHLPLFLQLILPMGFFIGILLVVSRLYADNEMVVLNACGMGPKRILRQFFSPTLVFTLLNAIVSLWLAPWGASKVDYLVEAQRNHADLRFITPGRFTPISGQKHTAYAAQVLNEGTQLQQVFVGQANGILIAESAQQNTLGDNNDRFLTLKNGLRFQQKLNGQFELLSFNTYSVKLGAESSIIMKARQEATPTSLLINSNKPKDQAQLQLRLSMILLVPIVALLAFPLAKINPRQGRFAKLLPAIFLYVLYYSLLVLITSLIADDKVPPGLHTLWIHLGFLLLAFTMNWRQSRASTRHPGLHRLGPHHATA